MRGHSCLLPRPSHCLLVVAVSSPGPVPTSRLVADRGGLGERGGGEAGGCAFVWKPQPPPPSCPLCPSSLPCLPPLPHDLQEAGKQDSAGNQGPLTPSCSASDPLCDPEPGPPPLWVSTISKHFSLHGQDWVTLCTGREVPDL